MFLHLASHTPTYKKTSVFNIKAYTTGVRQSWKSFINHATCLPLTSFWEETKALHYSALDVVHIGLWVDSLCRIGADMQYRQYLSKSCITSAQSCKSNHLVNLTTGNIIFSHLTHSLPSYSSWTHSVYRK